MKKSKLHASCLGRQAVKFVLVDGDAGQAQNSLVTVWNTTYFFLASRLALAGPSRGADA